MADTSYSHSYISSSANKSGLLLPPSSVDKLYTNGGVSLPHDINDQGYYGELQREQNLERYASLLEYASNPENQISGAMADIGLGADHRAIAEGIKHEVYGEPLTNDGSSILGKNEEGYNKLEDLYNILLQRDKNYNAFVSSENDKSREWQWFMDRQARAFEERMSSTAYQRAFSDMRAAGLNPYAMALGGSIPSASTPNSQPTIAPYLEAQKANSIEKVLSFYGDLLKISSQSSYYQSTQKSYQQNSINGTIQAISSILPIVLSLL